MPWQEVRKENEPFPFNPKTTELTIKMIEDIRGIPPDRSTVLDVGCGWGRLVAALREKGVSAFGCDVKSFWDNERPELSIIRISPYRLPYNDDTFDVVITNTILEHVHNHEELYLEIRRILKPGGCAIHNFPGRWYVCLGRWFLPVEPHIRVPFVHFIWPTPAINKVPRRWFVIWSRLGFRSPYQYNKSIDEIVESNEVFCQNELCYKSHKFHKEVSKKVFGNCEFPMNYFLSNGYGNVSKIYSILPFKRVAAFIFKHTRMALMVQRNEKG